MASQANEDELADRLTRQLEWGRDRHAAVLLWKGYLAGLYEAHVIDIEVYTRLDGLLPAGGNIEVSELFAGEKLSDQEVGEIENYATNRRA